MPRFHDNGVFYTVSLSEADVILWAQTWPCYGPRKSLWFRFDKSDGDVVDMSSDRTEANDPSGVLALSHDAQAWGAARLAGRRVEFRAGLALGRSTTSEEDR